MQRSNLVALKGYLHEMILVLQCCYSPIDSKIYTRIVWRSSCDTTALSQPQNWTLEASIWNAIGKRDDCQLKRTLTSISHCRIFTEHNIKYCCKELDRNAFSAHTHTHDFSMKYIIVLKKNIEIFASRHVIRRIIIQKNVLLLPEQKCQSLIFNVQETWNRIRIIWKLFLKIFPIMETNFTLSKK